MLICLNGPPRVGKTTFAKKLTKNYGIERLDLAMPFTAFVNNVFGYTMGDVNKDDPIFHERKSMRDVYIDIANIMESYDPNVWIKFMSSQIKKDKIYVIDSIGKFSQWVWLKDNLGINNLFVVWFYFLGDSVHDYEGFSDGRERIMFSEKDNFGVKGQVVTNTPQLIRDDRTLIEYDGICDRITKSVAESVMK